MHNTPHTAETKAKISAAKLRNHNKQTLAQRELSRTVNTTHGQSRPKTPAYYSWFNMKDRTTNPNNPRYASYGGRGISVCEEWLTFTNFFADMGARPDGTTLGRYGDEGNYEPGNCSWQTRAEQEISRRERIV
jgi:hypothetical protein